jgi:selenocysteine lyase/cysteine desulfurase
LQPPFARQFHKVSDTFSRLGARPIQGEGDVSVLRGETGVRHLSELRYEIVCKGGCQTLTNRSNIVSVPLGDAEPTHILAELKRRGVICSARDGNLRLAVHFYHREDDIQQVTSALSSIMHRTRNA